MTFDQSVTINVVIWRWV